MKFVRIMGLFDPGIQVFFFLDHPTGIGFKMNIEVVKNWALGKSSKLKLVESMEELKKDQ